MNRSRLLITLLFAASTASLAGEKTMMHCFAFTTIDTASEAEWKAFQAATDAMPAKNPAILRVWHGKLLRPLAQFSPDAETRKKFTPQVNEAEGKMVRLQRQYGVCFEFKDQGADALKAYTANPYHAEWTKAYEKVRRPGTTTYDILGQ
ncbi:MAG: hypothetical protein FJW20_24240 [Acidimicrobiia bacterium]|nr:hypothetical protein [Acidimicrobiia bacterium]